MTARTPAQKAAALRDGKWCQWCLKQSRLVPATDVHHLAGRHKETDVPELCVSLCRSCHDNVGQHRGEPTLDQLLDLMWEFHKLDLRILLPIIRSGNKHIGFK